MHAIVPLITHTPSCARARVLALAVAVVFGPLACDTDEPRARASERQSFADPSIMTDVPATDLSVLRVGSRLVATSANGSEADLAISWAIAPEALPAVTGATRLVVSLERDGEASRVLSRQRVSANAPAGDLHVSVPGDSPDAHLRLGLEGLDAGIVDDLPAYTTITLPDLLHGPATPLGELSSLRATLVPQSYDSTLENGRRLHRFAVRVDGTLGDGTDTAVTGLEKAASRHFNALEFGYDDPESPVRAAWQSEPVTVYLVMDVSSSITLAGAAHELLDAVSRTLLALAPVARFDYRVFASDVRKIASLRDIAFDDVEDSGTAFNYALDTALDDIESRPAGDVVLIAFTDGRDFASRNFYPAFNSHRQVAEHVRSRLANVRRARTQLSGSRFEAHVVSLGSDIDADALQGIASAGGGRWFASYASDTIDSAFAHLTDGVRGIYQLEYSSQQLPDDTELQLVVRVGEHQADPIALPTRFGLTPTD